MKKPMRTGLFVLLATILLLELLALAATAKSPDLDRIYANVDGTWYLNGKTMVNPAGNRVSVWSTIVPEKQGTYYEVLGMVLEKRGKDPRRLEYVQILQDVDCSAGKVSSSTALFYDKRDRIVHTVNSSASAQLIADFGQAEDTILAAVCGQQMARLTEE
jgi:hypothetical protein